MKQKIERFANGIFTYESPVIEVSEEAIYLSAIQGQRLEASFVVRNSANEKMRGFVTSPCENICLKTESFEGVENEITFIFDAVHLEAGSKVTDVINVVSDCGEAVITIEVDVTDASISTSLGQLSDVFHFTNLAMGSPQEARELFKSDSFRNIVIKNSPGFSNLYRSLAGAPNTSQALEEFLIASRKKKMVDFDIDCNELVYDHVEKAFVDKIAIKKNNWGFAQIKCDVQGSFIEAERSLIWSEDFEDGVFWLKFSLNPERMREGKNFGSITLSTIAESIVIPVTCRKNTTEGPHIQTKRKRDELQLKLMNNIIAYKLGRISTAKYVSDVETTMAILNSIKDETVMEKLYRIYVKAIGGNREKAIKDFESMSEELDNCDSIEAYAMSLMTGAFVSDNQVVINENFLTLRRLAEDEKNFDILMMAVEIDDKSRISKKMRLDAAAEDFYRGGRSALVLIEAAMMFAADPMLLKNLGSFETVCLKTSIRYGIMNKFLALQVAYLACREKKSSRLLRDVLKSIYYPNPDSELLEPVCMHIIMGINEEEEDCDEGEIPPCLLNPYSKAEIYRWLSMGVAGQLRINGLYERCLQASSAWDEPLPKQIITYFAAGMKLSDADKSALFANIIRFYPKDDNIYILFRNVMESYAYELLKKSVISREAAVIYNEFLNPSKISDELVYNLPQIMFCNEITSDWKKMTSVAVYHKEMSEPTIVKSKDGYVLTDIFTEDPVIVLMDDDGNRVTASFNISVRPLMSRPDLSKLMYEKCQDDIRVVLNRLESKRIEGASESLVSLIVKCVDYSGLNEEFLLGGKLKLIEYYYDNLEGDLLENLLVNINLSAIGANDRNRMIELMIFRELYSLALKNMEIFGYTGIEPKRLLKLCSTMIALNSSQISSKFFGGLCYYCFLKRRFDENILKYLEKNLDGSTQELYDLWCEAREEGIDTSNLEERLLKTALFSENDMLYVRDVFVIYYGHCSSGKLVRAYLSYLAYGSLVKDGILDQNILDIMKREANYSENDICTLVLLKDYSKKKRYTEQEKNYIEFQLKKMENKGILLPFFKDFGDGIRIPRVMRDKYYVEYHTDPSRRVQIHYGFCGDDRSDSYTDEEMRNVAYGIFVKEFILFYGEVLQYYISEIGEEQNLITESSEVSIEPELIGGEENRYHQLNLIMTAKEMQDEKTVIKLIENYAMNDYVVKRLFSPIEKKT